MSDAATQEIGTRRGDNSNVAVAPVTDIGVGGAGGGSSRSPFFASKRGSDAFSLTPLAWLASSLSDLRFSRQEFIATATPAA